MVLPVSSGQTGGDALTAHRASPGHQIQASNKALGHDERQCGCVSRSRLVEHVLQGVFETRPPSQ